MTRTLIIAVYFCLAAVASAANAQSEEQQDIEFASGIEQVTLLELYTSEGCSSCPPADRWLSKLKSDAKLWQEFIPIAFHVDYWDYIGWKDRFASREFSNRQRQYADEGAARSVYTPGFFSAGNEWLGWRSGQAVEATRNKVGNLSVRLNGTSIAIRFDPESPASGNLTAHVALLGMNVETSVRAGENRGKKLQHDFVALDVSKVNLSRNGSAYAAILQIPESSAATEQRSLAVWVSAGDRQAPIQATGGYLQ